MAEHPTHSPSPYVRVTVNMPDRRRTVWAEKKLSKSGRTVTLRVVNEAGEFQNEIIVAFPQDIIRERPARMNLKYGTLDVIDDTPFGV